MRPEHTLQIKLRSWVREALACPHLFLSFDRSKPAGVFTHMYEAARAVTAGTPDTLLILKNRPDIWCELKAPGGKLLPSQEQMRDALMALDRPCFMATSVVDYWRFLATSGVPMQQNARFLAELKDAAVESALAKAAIRKGKIPKSMKQRPSSSAVAKARKAGVLV